jgi:hypothetical protein
MLGRPPCLQIGVRARLVSVRGRLRRSMLDGRRRSGLQVSGCAFADAIDQVRGHVIAQEARIGLGDPSRSAPGVPTRMEMIATRLPP